MPSDSEHYDGLAHREDGRVAIECRNFIPGVVGA